MFSPSRGTRLTALILPPLLTVGGAAMAPGAERPLPAAAAHRPAASQKSMRATKARTRLAFEPNRGQTDGRVRFLARGRDYALFLTGTEAVFSFPRTEAPAGVAKPGAPAVLRMRLNGASARAAARGEERLPGKVSYFRGSSPSGWQTNVPMFGRVRCEGVYPGIDLVYYGNAGRLEYDFVVAPGADARRIELGFLGQRGMSVDSAGNLVVRTPAGDLRQERPVAYQTAGGKRRPVACRYAPASGGKVRFALGSYDRGKELVIDPLLYSTFLGGGGFDNILPDGSVNASVAVDAVGNTFVTGATASSTFPLGGGSRPGGPSDVYVARLTPDGQTLSYVAFLGGGGEDRGRSIRLDGADNAYVTGLTSSTNFPVTANALQGALRGKSDAFVSVVSADGASILFSTYLGGTGGENFDRGGAIAVGPGGNVIVAGETTSADFPFAGGTGPLGLVDAFVVKIGSPLGEGVPAVLYARYLGGADNDAALALAVDPADNAYVAGKTTSANFPVLFPITKQETFHGGAVEGDGFLTELDPSGSPVYSTYLGGAADDVINSIAVDAARSVYVAGQTESGDFPTAAPANHAPFQNSFGGVGDAFVAKISQPAQPAPGEPFAAQLDYSTYLGGDGDDRARGIAVDQSGDAWVTGHHASTNFPLGQNATQGSQRSDAFVVVLDPNGGSLLSFLFIPGEQEDRGLAIALDQQAPIPDAYVVGHTFSQRFCVVESVQAAYGGSGDGFVLKFGPGNFPSGGKLRVKPNVQFGSVRVKEKRTKNVFVRNVSHTECMQVGVFVRSIDPSAPSPFSILQGRGFFLVPERGRLLVEMQFSPTAVGAASGILNIVSSDPTRADVNVKLNGRGKKQKKTIP